MILVFSFVQNYFCGNPVAKKLPILNPNPSLASERRRGEEEVEEDTSIPVSNNQSWKKLFLSISRKSLCAFFQIFLHPHISLSAQKHVTFTMGGNLMGIASKYNGNCLRMKNLELPDCHSATPYILPTSNRIVAKISNFLHFFGVWCKTWFQKLCNPVSQNFIELPQVQSKCLENCLTSNSNWILSAFKLIETIQRWKMPNYAQAAISVRQKKERDLEKPHQQVPVKTRSKKENRKVVNPHCLVEACFTMLQYYSLALQRKKL